MSWRVFVAVIAAFVLGVVGGVYVEHQRVTDHTSASARTTTVPVATWFEGNPATACPLLDEWGNAARAAYAAAHDTTKTWSANQQRLMSATDSMTGAYRSLLPLANAKGKAELDYLVGYQAQVASAIQHAKSLAEFLPAQSKLGSARLSDDLNALSRMAESCAGS